MKRLVFVFTLGMTLLVSVAAAQEDPCFAGGFTDETNMSCNYHVGVDIDITYPNWVNDYDFARQPVQDFIVQSRDQMWNGFTSMDPGMLTNPWFLQIDYEEYTHSPDVQSILFTLVDYSGGAHPNTFYQTFVFDLAQEQQVMLDDLFTSTEDALAVISPIVQADLTAQMDEDLADPQWIEDGTGTNPDNYQNFVLTEDSLIFFFPPFQVAPYAAGAFEVAIPLADISSVLAPEYQAAG